MVDVDINVHSNADVYNGTLQIIDVHNNILYNYTSFFDNDDYNSDGITRFNIYPFSLSYIYEESSIGNCSAMFEGTDIFGEPITQTVSFNNYQDGSSTLHEDIYANYTLPESEAKTYHKNGWNWISFPKLYRDFNAPLPADTLLEDLLFSFVEMTHNRDEYISWDFINNQWDNHLQDGVTSTLGYKLQMNDDLDDYTQTVYGSVIPPETTVHLYHGQPNLIGYWIP